MNNKIIEDLAKLGIYKSKNLSEKEYNSLSKNNTDNSLIYINGCYEGGSESYNKYYKEMVLVTKWVDKHTIPYTINNLSVLTP